MKIGKPGILIFTDVVYSINGTDYTQSFSSDKDTSMEALAVQLAADANVNTAIYNLGAHTITCTPIIGKQLYGEADVSDVTGTMAAVAITTTPTYPDWCTGSTPNADSAGIPATNGYDDSGAGSIPSAKNWNWLMMILGQWVRYLKQQVDLISSLVASAITNDSSVTGTTVKDALNTLAGEIGTITEGNFDAIFLGPGAGQIFTVEQTVNVKYRVWQSATGGVPKLVTLTFPKLAATSNSVYMYALNCLPSTIKPSVDGVVVPIVVEDNGRYIAGSIRIQHFNAAIDFLISKIDATGNPLVPQTLQIVANDTAWIGPEAGYTAAGTKGFPAFSVTYPLY
jgi:hypothetical protein